MLYVSLLHGRIFQGEFLLTEISFTVLFSFYGGIAYSGLDFFDSQAFCG